MGTCLSKKATNASSPTVLPDPPAQTKANTPDPDKKIASTTEHQEILKKEIFVVKNRRSHEIERRKEEEKPSSDKEQILEISQPGNVSNASGFGGNGINGVIMAATPVRTSSCTKEELDAILIQCGRLSRSSSTGKAGSGENPNFARSGRKYSGSKRSYDFDQENVANDDSGGGGDEVVAEAERIHRHRNRQREPRVSSPSSSRRRRTPSRERDEQGNSQARSGSRERTSGNGGRRVSRSPGRRSESPITNSNGGHGSNSSSGNANRPGKMVSVPATVSSMAMDKSNNGGGEAAVGGGNGGVRRIPVKKTVGEAPAVGSRTSASPRARSPARANIKAMNENQNQEPKQQQQPLSLSRSNSRKAEQSPYRRNPLGDIDNNVPGNDQTNQPNKATMQKPNGEKMSSNKTSTNRDNKTKEQHIVDEGRGDLHSTTTNVAVTLVPAAAENLKLQGVTRTRSSRRSRDFDVITPETLLNPNPSYTSLLLDDIQNFHQKGTPQPAFSLPSCLTKACSILEAVADLNSTTSSNLSSTFSEDRRKNLIKNNDEKNLLGALEEPEMEVMGDMVEPTLHKYVTFRRGPTPTAGEDMEELESSGSNSFAGSQQVNWLSSSWEPTSADSSDCWTSTSKSNTREKDFNNPLGFQKSAVSEPGHEKKREMDNQRNGIGRGRLGSGRSALSMPNAASAST